MLFEWDEHKNRINQAKHGIDFELASLVFLDPDLLSELDHRYTYLEERWKTTGLVEDGLICVGHTVENDDDEENIRLITARAASSNEARRYRINRGNERGIACVKIS
ncbi:MAG: hypothetical protein A3E81_05885 [Gammaproteobacteria bacterium RIFCSPHIGHO2_12_FULL_36_30]|nr:MAG: hypothetical protein A3E81_05885 [Gammaproteobacteria bacterium RIFCSPHIGHO2_12_FULL_36_30]